MKKTFISILALSTLLIITVLVIAQNKTHSLSQTALKDEIKGGWAGQMIGVSFGAPTEFQSNGKIIEGQLKWTPDRVSNAIDQDDLYVEMTFTKVLDELGMNATCEQFGEGDFDKTLKIATRAGQDSDCNPSSAAGVLGVMMGYDKIPDQWKSGITALADKKFQFTDYSFNSIVDSTLKRTYKVVQSVGGKVTNNDIILPIQQPKAPKLEQWNPGVPEKIIQFKDPAWQWKGKWSDEIKPKDYLDSYKTGVTGKATNGAGAEAVLAFEGVAICLIGPMTQEGGRADVFLDGKKQDHIDAYIVERTFDYDLWHAYDLKPGKHTLRIVTRDDVDVRSKGKNVVLRRAIIYR